MNKTDIANRIKALGGTGILTEADIPELDTQRGRVLEFMSDGAWHSANDIREVAGGSEGLRRLRELRRLPGVDIQRTRLSKRRVWAYRLVIREPVPKGPQSNLPF